MVEKIEGLSIGLDLNSIGVENNLKQLKGKLGLVNSEMKSNMSAFDRSERSMKKYETQLSGLNKKLDVQKASVKAAKDEYDKMVERHGEGSRQAEKAAAVYNNQAASFNNLERHIESLNGEMREFENQQRIAESGWTTFSQNLERNGQRMTNVGTGMKSIGTNITKYVTLPLAGIGAAGFAAANELDEAYNNIRRGTGATGDALEDLKGNFENVFVNVPESAEEVSTALADLNTRTGLTGEALELATEQFLTLGRISGEDVPDLIAKGTRAFGDWDIAVEDQAATMDYFWKVSQSTGIGVSDLMTKVVQFGAPLRQMGFDFETSAALLGKFEKEGVNAELVMGSMRQALGRMAKEGIPAEEGLKKTVDAIKNAGSTSEANAAAIELFGARAGPDMAAAVREGRFEIDDLIDSLNDSGETIEAAGEETITFGDRMQIMKNKTMDALEPIGDVIMDVAEDYLPKLEAGIDKAATWFEGLGEEGQKTAILIGGVVAAAGPLIAIGGTLIAGIGGIMTAVAPLTAAIAGAGGLSAAMGTAGGAIAAFATGPIGLGIAAIAGLTVAGIAFYKHMSEDAIPEVDRFGEEVSETTKEALGKFFELSDGVGEAMSNLHITSAEVTEEIANDIVGKFESMNDQILEGMRLRHEEQLVTMQEFFSASSTLTAAEEEAILKRQGWYNDMQVAGQEEKEARIKEIMEAASKEKRELTETEKIEINGIQTSMNTEAVEQLSANEVEQQIIMQRMKDTAGDLSARQAAEVVQRATEQKDGAVSAAEEQYENTLAEIIRMRDESGSISEEQATKLIAEAKKTRDESVGYAESMHTDIVDQAKQQAGEHVELVDWSTGEILSKWDVYKNNVSRKFKKINEDSLADFKRWGGDFLDAVDTVKENAIDGWERYKTGINKVFRKAGQDGLNLFGSMVNGIIGSINWVLGKLDVKKISQWSVPNILGQQSAGTRSGANVRAYAHGTTGHPGGLALVGDGKGDNAGSEMIRTPDGKVGFSPARNTLLDLPKGTTVLSAKETRKLFGPIPKYANGIGDAASHLWESGKELFNAGKAKVFDIFDYLTNPKKLLDIGLAAVGFKVPTASGFLKDVLSGGFNKVKSGAIDFIKDQLSDFGGSGQGFGSAFRKTSNFGFRIHPITKTPSYHAGDDYGAPAGTPIPAQAAGRVVQSAYHNLRGNFVRIKSGLLERIYQHNQRNLVGVGETVRAGQYVGTVGSTGASTGPHLHYEVLRNGKAINPRGLATGGITTGFTTSTLHEEGWPEIVIPTNPQRRTDAMKLLALAGKKIAGNTSSNVVRPDQLPNSSGGGDSQLLELLKQQIALMQAILSNPHSVAMVTPNYDVLAEGTYKMTGELIEESKDIIRKSGGGDRL